MTYEDAAALYEYKDGRLYWKVDRGLRNKVKGQEASPNALQAGYRVCRINGKSVPAHRLIFLLHFKYLPDEIDHIDGNPLNNLIENLRPADRASNGQNRGIQKNNTSGFKNVSWHPANKKWEVRVWMRNKMYRFGMFNDIELANQTAIAARITLHAGFARHV